MCYFISSAGATKYEACNLYLQCTDFSLYLYCKVRFYCKNKYKKKLRWQNIMWNHFTQMLYLTYLQCIKWASSFLFWHMRCGFIGTTDSPCRHKSLSCTHPSVESPYWPSHKTIASTWIWKWWHTWPLSVHILASGCCWCSFGLDSQKL